MAALDGLPVAFLQVCGSTVPNMLRDTGYVSVPAGALDEDARLIGTQLFLGSKTKSDRPRTKGLQYGPTPDLRELISILHGERPAQQ